MNGSCRHIIKIDAGAYKQGIIKAEKTDGLLTTAFRTKNTRAIATRIVFSS
jgi:hypothetical protein